MRRLCTICARGGSKGVPHKNLRHLLGKPLIAYSIEHAREAGVFERIAISSDSPTILAAAKAAGADDLIERPPEMATDTASKLPAIKHALRTVEAQQKVKYETLTDLDVTSPLRLAEDVRGTVRLREETGATSVITGTPSHRSPYFNLVEVDANGFVNVAKPPRGIVHRRQDVPRTYDMDASIYVWDAEKFCADPKVFYHDTRLFEMPAERSRDIDSDIDFEIVEMLLRRRLGRATAPSRRFDLSGKVAVVTGGAGILGPHFARGLAEHGAAVALIDLDAAATEGQAQTIAMATGAKMLGLACDITDRAALKAAIDRIEVELGPIDILHNNAATKGRDLKAFFAPTEEYDLATWREVMAVNLDAMFLVAQEVGKRMIAHKQGSIIQTASIYGVLGADERIYEGSHYLGQAINTPPVYAASKAGVIGLTRYLATLWAKDNVRVNTLVPGGVESGQNDAFTGRYSARVPMGRMAHADEMIGTLIYLASDASSYVTGQILMVDGGLSAW